MYLVNYTFLSSQTCIYLAHFHPVKSLLSVPQVFIILLKVEKLKVALKGYGNIQIFYSVDESLQFKKD
jgi:hypothetical protein